MQQMPVLQPVAPSEGRLLRRKVPSLPVIKPDRLRTAKALVEKAVKLQKVFSVQGRYPVIRAALWAKGWVERRLPPAVPRAPHCHGDEEEECDDGDVGPDVIERVDEGEKGENHDDMYNIMSRLVRNETTYFYWTTRLDCIECRALRNDQMINHYANAGTFTTKVGLCLSLRNLQWFDTADPDTFFPRCYRLGAEDEKHAFIEDFKRTACTSLLQYVVETRQWAESTEEDEEQKVQNRIPKEPDGDNCQSQQGDSKKHRTVGPKMIGTALRVCQEFLNVLEHSDIDVTMETPPSVKEQQWAEFLLHYYAVVHKGALIQGGSGFVERCQNMLARLQQVCPQLDTDGIHNIWIVKPGAKSRGRGIICMNHLDDILGLVDSDRALNKDSKWVVQKYLERPLLIYGTKFDLRQWFLVTDWNPLTIWFYKECYLRFSTQPYSTKNLDSSVHLCNNSIQKHFQPSPDRHPGVPEDNMWSSSDFQVFLKQQGRGAEWESVVVPGMKQAVVRAMQTAQDLVEARKASFELYGADFMLGRDLRPWLLEINSSPTMSRSTAITARLCPAVQLDTLRVVLDRRSDPWADTGGFQLIHKQAAVEVPQYLGVNLLVEGAPIRRLRPLPSRNPNIPNPPLSIQFPSTQSSLEVREKTEKPSHQSHHAQSCRQRPNKENRSAGDKKRQLSSTSPKQECNSRTVARVNPCVHRFSHSQAAEPTAAVAQTEPRRKSRCLGLSPATDGEPLVTRTFSFSLSPPYNIQESKSQSSPTLRLHVSRFHLPKTAVELQHQTPALVAKPSPQCPLPSLSVFSLRPNIVARSITHNYPDFSGSSSFQRHNFFLRSSREIPVRKKEAALEGRKC